MEFKGSKGKWQLEFNSIKNIRQTMPKIDTHEIRSGNYVCLVYADIDNVESKANAKLISCAPEMLEMLKELVLQFEKVEKLYSKDSEAIEKAKNLIEKATNI